MSEIKTHEGYFNTEAAAAAKEEVSFSFGANWQRFLAEVDDKAVLKAEESFVQFTKLKNLHDYDFLDLGSGSGLSSLVALRLGARRVVSVDIDPNSVECTKALRQKYEIPEDRWQIHHGSVLDRKFLESLGRHNYVHSWGVLHHTGDMWQAVTNVIELNTVENGLFQTALYNKHRTSRTWLKIKRMCNRSPRFWFPVLKWLYISLLFLKMTLTLKSPIRYVREYDSHRGMNFFRDIDDWCGGLPYEFSSPAETVNFLSDRGFSLLRIKTVDSVGCNEFLFRRCGS